MTDMDPDILDPEPTEMRAIAPTALEAIARGEIDLQIKTAKEYPRSIKSFKQTALAMATLDQETAAGCIYALPRGGKPIEGPSVRLAEIIASAWGNLRVGTRIVDEGEKFVTAQSVAHDLERNVAISVEVRRRITDKHGRRYKDDMIGVTCNAAASIAMRNALFKTVPHVYTQEIYRAARHAAIGDVATLASTRAKLVEAFMKMGVLVDRIPTAVGKPSLDDMDLDDVATLRGLFTAIKDGDTTVDQAFPAPPKPEEQQAGAKGLKARLKATHDPEKSDSDGALEGLRDEAREILIALDARKANVLLKKEGFHPVATILKSLPKYDRVELEPLLETIRKVQANIQSVGKPAVPEPPSTEMAENPF